MRTGYSFKHAVGKIPDVLDKFQAVYPSAQYAPLADRGYCYGWHEWGKECRKRNLTPVFGVELAVCTMEDLHEESKPGRDYWIFYSDSMHSLNRLLRIATSQAKHIYKAGRQLRYPILDYEQACCTFTDNIHKIISYRTNVDELSILLDDDSKHIKNLYAGWSQALTYPQYFYMNSILNLPWVIVSENKYVHKDNLELYQTICNRGAVVKTFPQHILTMQELFENSKYYPPKSASFLNCCHENKRNIFQLCAAHNDTPNVIGARIRAGKIPEAPTKYYYDDTAGDKSDFFYRCYFKLKELGLDNDIYLERLNKEIDLIQRKKYVNYFEIVADICEYAKKHMLVGPGRGSAAGSLVCYLLDITSVDPIKYDLSFERFLTEFRTDLPDIDIDFPDRDKVIKYLKDTYGHEYVAKLGTVNMFGPRSALRDSASAMGIKIWATAKTVDALIEYPAGSEEAKQALAETLDTTNAGKKLIQQFPELELTKQVENHPRHSGVHAGGVIVSAERIDTLGPIDRQEDGLVLMTDKRGAEDNDLLKIDILGLHTLAIIDYALQMAGIKRKSLPTEYNDPEVFKVIQDKKYAGIFQFEGDALRAVCNKFTLDSFEDMVVVTSIARAGASGSIKEWLEKRNSDTEYKPQSKLGKLLEKTQGVLIYQEQVMSICRELAKLPWEDVMAIRKAIGKSKGEEAINKYGKKFKNNLLEQNYSDAFVNNLWAEIVKHGGYSFNRSHAVCYSVVGYWCMWLKRYYPKEFAAATLTFTKDEDKKRNTLIELVEKEGIDYIAVDEKLSEAERWIVRQNKLIGPLVNVHGIGPKLSQQIVGARRRGEGVKKTLLEKIRNNPIPLGELYPVRQAGNRLCDGDIGNKIKSKITNIEDIEIGTRDRIYSIVCTPVSLRLRDINEDRLVELRNGKIIPHTEPTEFMSGYVKDDTGKITIQINRFTWQDDYARQIFKRGKFDNAIYAIRGIVKGGKGKTFKLLHVKNFKYLGDMK